METPSRCEVLCISLRSVIKTYLYRPVPWKQIYIPPRPIVKWSVRTVRARRDTFYTPSCPVMKICTNPSRWEYTSKYYVQCPSRSVQPTIFFIVLPYRPLSFSFRFPPTITSDHFAPRSVSTNASHAKPSISARWAVGLGVVGNSHFVSWSTPCSGWK